MSFQRWIQFNLKEKIVKNIKVVILFIVVAALSVSSAVSHAEKGMGYVSQDRNKQKVRTPEWLQSHSSQPGQAGPMLGRKEHRK